MASPGSQSAPKGSERDISIITERNKKINECTPDEMELLEKFAI
jgi:hypothetical protein